MLAALAFCRIESGMKEVALLEEEGNFKKAREEEFYVVSSLNKIIQGEEL